MLSVMTDDRAALISFPVVFPVRFLRNGKTLGKSNFRHWENLGKSNLRQSLVSKNEKLECIKSIIINGEDVLAVLPAGYGKQNIIIGSIWFIGHIGL